VVELLRRAGRFVVDSRAVELEGVVRSIDGNRDGSLGSSVEKRLLITRSDVGVRLEGGTDIGSGEAASSVFSSVRIRRLSVNSVVGDDVVHGSGHETTVASLVSLSSGTIHKVLLRETDELVAGQKVATFCGSSGGERPARAALSLVLDGSDSSLLSPVHGGGCTDDGFDLLAPRGQVNVGWHSVSQVELLEFSVGKVTELVHGEGDSVLLGVVVGNVIHVSLEGGITTSEFVVVVGLGVLLHPSGEGKLVLLFSESGHRGDEEKGEDNEDLHVCILVAFGSRTE
jgi:hypothetical protein